MSKARVFLEMIKFEHTIFALPFAYVSVLLSVGVPSWGQVLWITLAMAGARTVGMAANRLIDEAIDRRNPRTSGRPLPSGRLTRFDAWAFTFVATGVFLAAVYQLSPRAQQLWPIVIALMIAYPYAKRWTWSAHFVLGLVYFIVPPGVWIALTNGWTNTTVALAIASASWVAGFDILYACQDVEVDRREGLHSIPADFGLHRALFAARALHVVTVAALAATAVVGDAGPIFGLGVAAVAVLLVVEHRLVRADDLSRLDAAFFTVNGVVSVAFFAFTLIDMLLRRVTR
jgi:4-hydroxybenzoate polyprenyltransferase